MTECVFNPDTNRCVKKDGKVGKGIMEKYGADEWKHIIINKCKFQNKTNRCVLVKNISQNARSIPVVSSIPVVPPIPMIPKQSPRAIQQITRLTSGVRLSEVLKNVSSNNCDIIHILESNGFHIKNIESLTKHSASETIIIKITSKEGVELIAKVGYQLHDILKDELFVETFIYKFLDKFNIPFVVEYVKQFTCHEPSNFSGYLPEDIQLRLRLLEDPQIKTRGLNILLTKMCSHNCKTLRELFTKNSPTSEDANGILLQCLYALVYFQEIGLQHNDLHLGNIFVEETPSNISLQFSNQTTFTFKCKYIVKIYDFDFSSIVPTKYNYNTFYPNRRIDKYYHETLCLSNHNNHGARDTAQFLLNYIYYYNNGMSSYIASKCLPQGLINSKRPTSEDRMMLSKSNPDFDYFKDKDILPFTGHPCKVYEDKFEIYRGIRSVKQYMSVISLAEFNAIVKVLQKPDDKLNLIRPVLPSLATSCGQYTRMHECMTPNKPQVSPDRRAKFRKAMFKATKLF